METLVVLGVPGAVEKNGRPWIHHSVGLVIAELARHCRRILLAVPRLPVDHPQPDFELPENVTLRPLPAALSAAQGIRKQGEIARIYREVISGADAVFARGVLIPAISTVYRETAGRDIPVIHWLPGNPHALLRSHNRDGLLRDTLGKLFIWYWEREVRAGARPGRAVLLCNGQEIADRFPDARTEVTVSTTLRPQDISDGRHDTCRTNPIQILTVAFIRPEKGIQYLLQALPLLQCSRPVELTLAGSRDRYPAYQARLDALVADLGLGDKVHWVGHADHRELDRYYQAADIFVLPTLSEGTPRVLLEAQARGLPVIASDVGGIPTAIGQGRNGLLVPAKDPRALAAALDRMISQGSLRQRLIASGYEFARRHTVDRFAGKIMGIFADLSGRAV